MVQIAAFQLYYLCHSCTIEVLHIQPPMVVCKMEAQSEYIYTCCTHVFARLALICTLSQWLSTKFLHRSSGGSLLRVRCWLGKCYPSPVWTFSTVEPTQVGRIERRQIFSHLSKIYFHLHDHNSKCSSSWMVPFWAGFPPVQFPLTSSARDFSFLSLSLSPELWLQQLGGEVEEHARGPSFTDIKYFFFLPPMREGEWLKISWLWGKKNRMGGKYLQQHKSRFFNLLCA